MAFVPAQQSFHNPETGYKWSLINVGHETVRRIEHPGVYLVGYTQLNPPGVNAFLRDHQIETYQPWGRPEDYPVLGNDELRNARGTDDELLVELSGRLCYMSYDRPRPGGLESFIENLKSEGHGSVFEHPHYSFIVSGVSRNLSLEANRHRTFSISQLSGRFVNPDEVGFVGDPDWTLAESQGWAERCLGAMTSYHDQYERNFRRVRDLWIAKNPDKVFDKQAERKVIKKARERARDILPGCLETRVLYTVNTRAIRFIFEKRLHPDAAFEIRRCFGGLFRQLQKHDPKLFRDYTEVPLDDGTFAVETKYQKI